MSIVFMKRTIHICIILILLSVGDKNLRISYSAEQMHKLHTNKKMQRFELRSISSIKLFVFVKCAASRYNVNFGDSMINYHMKCVLCGWLCLWSELRTGAIYGILQI